MTKKFPTFFGFTLVELIISLAIFALMTALLVAKYGSFNQGILLTNLAYDVALTLRTAQSYGLNVKSLPNDTNNYSDEFTVPYGVHFDVNNGTQILFFSDSNKDSRYTGGEPIISTYTIKRGSIISSLCTGTSAADCGTTLPQTLDVVFQRPNPDAIINGVSGINGSVYAEIRLLSSDGGTKKVIVSKGGQIAVSH